MSTLFISDLHLDDSRPATTHLFRQFLRDAVQGARTLYILGDLFERWVGDDDPCEVGSEVADGLAALAARGTDIHFIHGNRDFLLGHDYARRCRMRLLPDPSIILLDGEPVLLGHGDLLCSDDLAYQQFRAISRTPQWRSHFLAQPLAARLAFAEQARAASRARHDELQADGQAETITDASPATVAATFARYGIHRMVHGHTHRPAIHQDSHGNIRIVLGDWYEQGSLLRAENGHWHLLGL